MSVSLEERFEICTQRWGKLYSTRGTCWKFMCPDCHRKSLQVDYDKGIWWCFICEHGGGHLWGDNTPIKPARPVDKELHVAVRDTLLEISTLSKSHRQYLADRGIYDPERYHIKSVPAQVDKLLLTKFTGDQLVASGFFRIDPFDGKMKGWPTLKFGRILVPTLYHGQVVALKTRADPFDLDSRQVGDLKYSVPRGSLPGHFLYWVDVGPDVVVTEGEFKAIAGCETAIPSWGLSGMTARKNTLPQMHHIIRKYGVKRVFVVLDSEEPTVDNPHKEEDTWNSAIKLAKHIGEVACPVKLPRIGRGKMDFDKFLVEYGDRDFWELAEDAWSRRDEDNVFD